VSFASPKYFHEVPKTAAGAASPRVAGSVRASRWPDVVASGIAMAAMAASVAVRAVKTGIAAKGMLELYLRLLKGQ